MHICDFHTLVCQQGTNTSSSDTFYVPISCPDRVSECEIRDLGEQRKTISVYTVYSGVSQSAPFAIRQSDLSVSVFTGREVKMFSSHPTDGLFFQSLKHLLKAVTLENLISHRSLLHEGKLVLTGGNRLQCYLLPEPRYEQRSHVVFLRFITRKHEARGRLSVPVRRIPADHEDQEKQEGTALLSAWTGPSSSLQRRFRACS